jgi:excisionase family DNA binding protein
MMMVASNFKTVRQVADILSVSTNVVYREIQRRRLACYHVGGVYRISDAQLEDYLAESELGTELQPREFKHVLRLGG